MKNLLLVITLSLLASTAFAGVGFDFMAAHYSGSVDNDGTWVSSYDKIIAPILRMSIAGETKSKIGYNARLDFNRIGNSPNASGKITDDTNGIMDHAFLTKTVYGMNTAWGLHSVLNANTEALLYHRSSYGNSRSTGDNLESEMGLTMGYKFGDHGVNAQIFDVTNNVREFSLTDTRGSLGYGLTYKGKIAMIAPAFGYTIITAADGQNMTHMTGSLAATFGMHKLNLNYVANSIADMVGSDAQDSTATSIEYFLTFGKFQPIVKYLMEKRETGSAVAYDKAGYSLTVQYLPADKDNFRYFAGYSSTTEAETEMTSAGMYLGMFYKFSVL